ncbi:uncharacterized protein [Branchiostoma lanceolatum]|uniref:uncharacterized protein n=1 Tax=Branchiostoma lanceolatum TaxID=7740 RepID=UPI00345589B3
MGKFWVGGTLLSRDSLWVVDSAGTQRVNSGVTYDAAKALDGDTGTFWNPQDTEFRHNNWYITLDLTAPHTLTHIAVNNYGDTTHDIAAFTLQKSQVGSPYNWEDVVSVKNVQGGTDQRQVFGGFQGTARYWKFVITRTHSGYQPYLTELNLGTSPDLPHLSGVNVALTRKAYQTSTSGAAAASYAVDGDTNTRLLDSAFRHQSCTHTHKGEADPSWWVDLGFPFMIERVVIFNRQDCCSERLNPFNIHIGDSSQVSANPKCGANYRINGNQPSISVWCQGMRGRFVGVRLPGLFRTLSLCEVQVFVRSTATPGDSAVNSTCVDNTSITTSTDKSSNEATTPFVKTELAQKESINDVAAPKSSIQKGCRQYDAVN